MTAVHLKAKQWHFHILRYKLLTVKTPQTCI